VVADPETLNQYYLTAAPGQTPRGRGTHHASAKDDDLN
jgi:hypothetical protein